MTNHLDLIRKVVWRYVKTNPGLEYEDLFSEACIAYLEGIDKFDPRKGKASTFVWTIVSNRLNALVRKEYSRMSEEQLSEDMEAGEYLDPGATPEQSFIAHERWMAFVEQLSPEARVICDMVVNEHEIYLPTHQPKKCRGILLQTLRDRKWTWNQIWDTFREVKDALAHSEYYDGNDVSITERMSII